MHTGIDEKDDVKPEEIMMKANKKKIQEENNNERGKKSDIDEIWNQNEMKPSTIKES